ncbi:hypothetical protein, partial [Halorhodospira halophila]|uniref:hypothetical protein n=1 Tax=Halorhodospira halophila TaxID=1053 RepID=UPI001F5D4BA3
MDSAEIQRITGITLQARARKLAGNVPHPVAWTPGKHNHAVYRTRLPGHPVSIITPPSAWFPGSLYEPAPATGTHGAPAASR